MGLAQYELLMTCKFCLKYHLKPRGGKWSFENQASHKIIVKFVLIFGSYVYVRLAVSFFRKAPWSLHFFALDF